MSCSFRCRPRSTRLGSIPGSTRRAGHDAEGRGRVFRGVATVCLKLFHLARPDRVYFGRKDAQQVAVIRALLRDLDLEPVVALRVMPTIRDPDGLAPVLAERVPLRRGTRPCAGPAAGTRGGPCRTPIRGRSGGRHTVLDGAPGLDVDYVAIADFDGPTLAAAVRIGGTRLIDNVLLTDEDADGGGPTDDD